VNFTVCVPKTREEKYSVTEYDCVAEEKSETYTVCVPGLPHGSKDRHGSGSSSELRLCSSCSLRLQVIRGEDSSGMKPTASRGNTRGCFSFGTARSPAAWKRLNQIVRQRLPDQRCLADCITRNGRSAHPGHCR
jgi:hypothetical protein